MEFDPELAIKLRDVYEDFVALQSDFDDFDWNISEKTLSIVVGPIKLEDVLLGVFRIVLHWDQLGGSKPYEVLALDPNSPNDQSDVTHPHVHANQLCEGEGRAPIRHALEQGRFHDFFQLVTQILETYNESSAYVTLSNWSGKVFGDLFTLFGIMGVMLALDWRLALVTFSVIPFFFLLTNWFRKGARESFRQTRKWVARINAFLQENLTGMSVAQLFRREERNQAAFAEINRKHADANMSAIFYYAVFYPAIEQEDRHANGKAQDVKGREKLVFNEAAPGGKQ